MKFKLALFLGLGFLLFACNNYSTEQDILVNLSGTALEEEAYDAEKIIKRGYISFETSDFQNTKTFINEKLKQYKGRVSSENIHNYGNKETHSLTLRIPSTSFYAFVNEIESEAKNLQSKNISTEDVTSEFVDVKARLKNKKALEERYLELLKQGKNITDILEIEKQITQLRAEIESVEGRLKYLNDQVDYSTLEISYFKEKPKGLLLGSKLQSGFINGWNNLLLFIVGLVNLWPFLILIGLVMWFLIVKRKKKSS